MESWILSIWKHRKSVQVKDEIGDVFRNRMSRCKIFSGLHKKKRERFNSLTIGGDAQRNGYFKDPFHNSDSFSNYRYS